MLACRMLWLWFLPFVAAENIAFNLGSESPNVTKEEKLNCTAIDGSYHSGQGFCFECLSKNNVISIEKVCDGSLDCDDFSDECLCSSHTVPKEACEILYDPNVDRYLVCTEQTGNVNCGEGKCHALEEICGRMKSCPNGVHEKLCGFEETETARTIPCNKSSTNGSLEIVDAVMCDGVIECSTREDECTYSCLSQESPTLPPFCSTALSCLPANMICDGIWQSESTPACGFTRITEEEIGCPDRFSCAVSGKTSIEMSKVCDGNLDCDDGSDESITQNCTDGRFYCYDSEIILGSNLTTLETPFVYKKQTFNGKGDCPDTRDECHYYELTFNSRTEMVSSTVLWVFLWINGVKALFSNSLVYGFTMSVFYKKHKQMNKISRSHHILVANLSISDLLMGVYLVAVGIKGVSFSGRYCENDLEWRSSDTCAALGAISLISSEMSSGFLLIMAIFRFATIYRPVETFQSLKTEKIIRSCIILSWIVSVMIAILPLLGPLKKGFTSHGVIDCPIYDNNMIELGTLQQTSLDILTYLKNTNQTVEISSVESLEDIQALHKFICPQSEMKWIGFYGQNSICMPRIFATTQDPGWQYSFVILMYTFISFAILMVCYILIVRISARPKKQLGAKNQVPICKLQRRVSKLVITDFVCWIPVCVIGFVYFAGVPISSTLYAVCGIILIPVNSALNPAIYSGICGVPRRWFKKLRKTKNPSSTEGKSQKTSQVPSV